MDSLDNCGEFLACKLRFVGPGTWRAATALACA